MTARPVRIALVGPRAAGKTTIGRALAAAVGWAFVDADEELARRTGQPAGEHLRTAGEPAFRAVEQQIGLELLQRRTVVIAFGGGAVLSGAIRAALRAPGTATVLLIATPEVLAARIARAGTARPSLTGAPPDVEVAAVLAARLELYRAAADLTCDTGVESVAAIVAAVQARWFG